MRNVPGRAFALTTALGVLPRAAHAQAVPASQPPTTETRSEPAPAPSTPKSQEVVPSKAPERQTSLDPKRTELAPVGRTTFDIDPLADSAMIAVSLGFAGTLEAINSTGEIRPQQIAPNFDTANLVGIDRSAVNQPPDPDARSRSTLALGVAAAYAVVDPILSGVREHNVQTRSEER